MLPYTTPFGKILMTCVIMAMLTGMVLYLSGAFPAALFFTVLSCSWTVISVFSYFGACIAGRRLSECRLVEEKVKPCAFSSQFIFRLDCPLKINEETEVFASFPVCGQYAEDNKLYLTLVFDRKCRGAVHGAILGTSTPLAFFEISDYFECFTPVDANPIRASRDVTVDVARKDDNAFDALKLYETGDELSKIYWKYYARSGKLATRHGRERYAERRGLTVLIDATHRSEPMPDDLEHTLNRAELFMRQVDGDVFDLKLLAFDRFEIFFEGDYRRIEDRLLSLRNPYRSSLSSMSEEECENYIKEYLLLTKKQDWFAFVEEFGPSGTKALKRHCSTLSGKDCRQSYQPFFEAFRLPFRHRFNREKNLSAVYENAIARALSVMRANASDTLLIFSSFRYFSLPEDSVLRQRRENERVIAVVCGFGNPDLPHDCFDTIL